MDPNEIKSLMVKKHVKGSEIAASERVSRSCVSQVVNRKIRSRRIQMAIANALDLPFERIWGKAA